MESLFHNIIDNKNGEYDLLHRKRELYQILKDMEAVNITLTIQYGSSKMSFKVDRKSFCRALTDPNETCKHEWGVAYDSLNNFLMVHKKSNSRYADSYDFMNITEIKYRRDIIFQNDLRDEKNIANLKNKKIKNKEERGR